jgi:hypothetical protein
VVEFFHNILKTFYSGSENSLKKVLKQLLRGLEGGATPTPFSP